MKYVSHESTPPTKSEAPTDWLEEKVYGPKRQRTASLVRQAVDDLVRHGKRVSLNSVAAHSKQIDSTGTGVSESAVLANEEARAYYEQHRTWKGSRNPRAAKPTVPASVPRIKPDRDLARVRQRYLRLSKQELVDRLLTAEQHLATQEARWLKLNDELLSAKLREGKPGI